MNQRKGIKLKNNKIERIDGKTCVGYTSKNEKFTFDAEDLDIIKKYCWFCNDNGYLISKLNGVTVYMSRLLMNCPNDKQYEVDHINHDIKDNRKSNLRIVNRSQNNMNHKLRSDNVSGVTGVYFHKCSGKWISTIFVNYERIYLGIFNCKQDAINARLQAEEKYFGEYSYNNSTNKFRKDKMV